MNIFTIFLFYKIVAQYTPERIKMHHLKKIFSREHALEPPSIQVANSPRSAWHKALCK